MNHQADAALPCLNVNRLGVAGVAARQLTTLGLSSELSITDSLEHLATKPHPISQQPHAGSGSSRVESLRGREQSIENSSQTSPALGSSLHTWVHFGRSCDEHELQLVTSTRATLHPCSHIWSARRHNLPETPHHVQETHPQRGGRGYGFQLRPRECGARAPTLPPCYVCIHRCDGWRL